MNNAIFVDTWALLALANRRDSFHSIASICYESIAERSFSLVTTDYVLDETITALFKEVRFDEATKFIQALLEAADSGQIVLEGSMKNGSVLPGCFERSIGTNQISHLQIYLHS
jgi:predicted nucleic acid-binding protein